MTDPDGPVHRPLRLAAALLLLCIAVAVRAAPTVRLCVDDNFAPFEYSDIRQASAGLHQVRGATINLVERILKRHGIAYQIEWFPWTRCLAKVEQGEIQIGMDAYFDPQRNRQIVYSEPYFTLTPQYYYLRSLHPGGLLIRQRSDLKRFHGCGILGFSYTHYGLSDRDIDTGSADHDGLLRKLKAGRCDYFVEEHEVMRGYALTGHRYLADPDLGHGPVPGAVPPRLHFILTRGTDATRRLLPLLNREIIQLRAQDAVRQLVERDLARAP